MQPRIQTFPGIKRVRVFDWDKTTTKLHTHTREPTYKVTVHTVDKCSDEDIRANTKSHAMKAFKAILAAGQGLAITTANDSKKMIDRTFSAGGITLDERAKIIVKQPAYSIGSNPVEKMRYLRQLIEHYPDATEFDYYDDDPDCIRVIRQLIQEFAARGITLRVTQVVDSPEDGAHFERILRELCLIEPVEEKTEKKTPESTHYRHRHDTPKIEPVIASSLTSLISIKLGEEKKSVKKSKKVSFHETSAVIFFDKEAETHAAIHRRIESTKIIDGNSVSSSSSPRRPKRKMTASQVVDPLKVERIIRLWQELLPNNAIVKELYLHNGEGSRTSPFAHTRSSYLVETAEIKKCYKELTALEDEARALFEEEAKEKFTQDKLELYLEKLFKNSFPNDIFMGENKESFISDLIGQNRKPAQEAFELYFKEEYLYFALDYKIENPETWADLPPRDQPRYPEHQTKPNGADCLQIIFEINNYAVCELWLKNKIEEARFKQSAPSLSSAPRAVTEKKPSASSSSSTSVAFTALNVTTEVKLSAPSPEEKKEEQLQSWIRLADDWYRRDNLEEMKFHLDQAVAINPRHPTVLEFKNLLKKDSMFTYRLGVDYFLQNDNEQALDLQKEALALNSKNIPALLNKAELLRQKADKLARKKESKEEVSSVFLYQEALADLTLAVKILIDFAEENNWQSYEASYFYRIGKEFEKYSQIISFPSEIDRAANLENAMACFGMASKCQPHPRRDTDPQLIEMAGCELERLKTACKNYTTNHRHEPRLPSQVLDYIGVKLGGSSPIEAFLGKEPSCVARGFKC